MGAARERLREALFNWLPSEDSGADGPHVGDEDKLIDDVIAEAQPAETYVLALSVGPSAVSTDLEALKRRAEKKEAWHASEFKWEVDQGWGTKGRLQLHYVSESTGRWNKSGYFIDKIQVVGAEG
jgi:hypothetical protein